jgi:SAM-dependent methyltransferase
LTRGLAFLGAPERPDYGARLSRLRWYRAAEPDLVEQWPLSALARDAVAGADTWVAVRDARSIPLGRVPHPGPEETHFAEDVSPGRPPFAHTLRELKEAPGRPGRAVEPGRAAAQTFRREDFPAGAGETVDAFLRRIAGGRPEASGRFRAARFEETSELERPELTRRLPDGALRVLDVGCGAGGAIAGARGRRPGWAVTGIERDPGLASLARGRCDRVLEGDLRRVLPELARSGERFDAIVFADVLEHLADPFSALRQARALAGPGAVLLVSVPNAGHLSLVRDLLCGRFDPVPAGLADAGHLRWFTRASLFEAIEEGGWRVEGVEAEPGAPAPDPGAFLAMAAAWPDCDRESLSTYQWVALGKAS